MENDLKLLVDWSKQGKLQFNLSKCKNNAFSERKKL